MAWRSYATLAALVLTGAAFTGCIESLSALSTDAEVSAMENADLAQKAATAWQEDAALVGLMAFELSSSDEPRIAPDPDPGNGLAPAWWYIYCSEAAGNEIRAYKVAADGTVTSEADAEAMAASYDHSMAETIKEWKVDSDAAIEKAKTDASFAKAAQGFNATVVEGVAHVEGKAAWWVSAISADGFVVATVDAVTGELLDVKALDMDFEMPDFAWGAANPELQVEPVHVEGAGSAEPGAEPIEYPFTLAGALEGELDIAFAAELPTDGLHWAILDAEGETVAEDHLRSWMGDMEYSESVELEDAGDYVLAVWYMGSSFNPGLPLPIENAVDYEFTLDFGGEHEHEEDDG